MYTYRFSFYSLKGECGFKAKSEQPEPLQQLIYDLLAVFAEFDEIKDEWAINGMQQKTRKVEERINAFASKYQKQLPVLNALPPFIQKLEEGEHFLFVPKIDLPQDERFKFFDHLQALKNGKSFEEIHQERMSLFGLVHSNYSLRAFGDIRLNIGEPIRSERICRFCNNERTPLSFKKKAHAISEALGNKTLILHDECDGCNEYFGKNIEPDIIEFFATFRTFFGVKGKGGEKNYEGKNFKLKKETEKKFHIQISVKKKDEGKEDFPYELKLKSAHPLNVQNIYKSLCKYFLSVIDTRQLPQFENTIKWINGEIEVDNLPRVAETISYHHFTHQPKLMTYIRKSEDISIPYAVGELHFTCVVVIFIIPLVKPSQNDFTIKDNWEKFWETFKHYKDSKGWAYHNFSDSKPKPFSVNLLMNMRKDDHQQ